MRPPRILRIVLESIKKKLSTNGNLFSEIARPIYVNLVVYKHHVYNLYKFQIVQSKYIP